ncbi:MAG: phosphate ABC transporter substrate-binding protein PstS [Candidatus Dormibacteria bacterium]
MGTGNLQGSGSSFAKPYLDAASFQYTQQHSAVTVNYPGGGSSQGIKDFSKSTGVDFGCSDVPMTSSEVADAGGADSLVQVPTVLGTVAVAYKLDGFTGKVNLDGPTLAAIFLGKVKKWNDPAVTALNSGANLPGKDIAVQHRSDGSGTSYIFTDYLSKVSPEWKSGPGTGKTVSWPAGTGAPGNSGVGNAIANTDGAIGYVELAYVLQSAGKVNQAYLKNKDGKFVQATAAGGSAAAAKTTGISATNFSVVDAAGADTYPISGFTWCFLRTKADAAKGKAVVNFFKFATGDGQQYGKPLGYSPLPKEVSDLAVSELKKIKVDGKAILG